MIRTVPNTGNEEIELYMRTYYSLLRSSDAIKIQALVESHTATDSALHVFAHETDRVDVSALLYASLRLPPVMEQVKTLILAQLTEDFRRIGIPNVEEWTRVNAPGRRRRTHFNGVDTLAVMIASRSDIDDIIPILTTFQIEWNKIHRLLDLNPNAQAILQSSDYLNEQDMVLLAEALGLEVAELARLQAALKENFIFYLRAMAERKIDLSLQLLASSQVNYRKAASRWWENLDDTCREYDLNIREYPVYFVSSNTHVISNLISGYAQEHAKTLQGYMARLTQVSLLAEWEALENSDDLSRANFLYYLLKKYQAAQPDSFEEMLAYERGVGMYRVEAEHGFDVEGQIIRLRQLMPDRLDSRLTEGIDIGWLAQSDAIIINIDYPLGLAAFELLTRVGEGCAQLLGTYIMGKAATLNGRVGDVMLPNVVHDEHSKNTYLFNNCFKASQLSPYLAYGMLLDNQKALTARGTFLQNRDFMDVFYKEGYTIIEMEAGPYLSAMYEMIRPTRHPSNEIVNLHQAPFDVGFIHYASDTPYSKGHNLGAGSLGYQGMDATYASAVAIMRRIFSQEVKRLSQINAPQKTNV